MRSDYAWVPIVLLLTACGADVTMDPTPATTMSPSGPTMTVGPDPTSTTTTPAGEPSTATVDLLDGSGLEIVGPAELHLSGYSFTLEVPEIGSSTVDLSRRADPADGASVDEAAMLESDLGNGIRLWRADREGQPFYMTVDLGGWGAFVHVGNEIAPGPEHLRSLAKQLRGEARENGVVLTNHEPDIFTAYLSGPATENQIHLAANQCVRENLPGTEVVEDPMRGELIRGPGYGSWCDEDADLEVMVFGDQRFVERVVNEMTLRRARAQMP